MINEINIVRGKLEDNYMFKKLIVYYQKNWYNNKFILFEICYDKIIKIKTVIYAKASIDY